MINLKLERQEFTEESTIGSLFIDGKFFCYTLEDPVRDHKIKGSTAIPPGLYKCTFTFSNRFQKIMPLLLDVPNYEGVRIHSGNTAKDTEGCILVGQEKKPNMIFKSRPAYFNLMLALKHEDFTIHIS